MRKTLDDDWSEKYRCGTALYVDENGNRRWDQSLDCMFREKELQLAAALAAKDAAEGRVKELEEAIAKAYPTVEKYSAYSRELHAAAAALSPPPAQE